jgi:uncharacterized membrane protein YhdT
MKKAAIYGIAMWVAGTVAIRLAGAGLLRAGATGRICVLYVASFLLMAWLAPRICAGIGIERGRWFEAAALLMLPTLVLDPWACVFFGRVYPNMDPAVAGLFGGWMLVFCAGAVAGVLFARKPFWKT